MLLRKVVLLLALVGASIANNNNDITVNNNHQDQEEARSRIGSVRQQRQLLTQQVNKNVPPVQPTVPRGGGSSNNDTAAAAAAPGLLFYSPDFLEQERLAGRHVDLNDIEPCGTKSPTEQEVSQMNKAAIVSSWDKPVTTAVLAADPPHRRNLQAAEPVYYVIPVHFHILKETSQSGGLSTESQKQFITLLNRGFRDSAFTFTLSGGTESINADWHKCNDEEGFKKALGVVGSDILNVYVCNLYAQKPGQIGYSYYPPVAKSSWSSLDGVVIMNPDLHVYKDLTVFYGLVHEVGHYFGLAHTFEGGCSTDVNNLWEGEANYTFSGDGVEDTPAHSDATFHVADGASTCWQTADLDTCDDSLGCDPGKDPVNNFMNILPGNCYEQYGRFTEDQLERMQVQYETFRFRGIFYEIVLETQNPPVCKKRRESCTRTRDCCGTLRCGKKRLKCSVLIT